MRNYPAMFDNDTKQATALAIGVATFKTLGLVLPLKDADERAGVNVLALTPMDLLTHVDKYVDGFFDDDVAKALGKSFAKFIKLSGDDAASEKLAFTFLEAIYSTMLKRTPYEEWMKLANGFDGDADDEMALHSGPEWAQSQPVELFFRAIAFRVAERRFRGKTELTDAFFDGIKKLGSTHGALEMDANDDRNFSMFLCHILQRGFDELEKSGVDGFASQLDSAAGNIDSLLDGTGVTTAD